MKTLVLFFLLCSSSIQAQWWHTRTQLWDSVITKTISEGGHVSVLQKKEGVEYRIDGFIYHDERWSVFANLGFHDDSLYYLYLYRLGTEDDFRGFLYRNTVQYGKSDLYQLKDSTIRVQAAREKDYIYSWFHPTTSLSIFYDEQFKAPLIVISVARRGQRQRESQ